jgi:hypothetical protein
MDALRKTVAFLYIVFFLLTILTQTIIADQPTIINTSLDQLPYQQEIIIPFDTSLQQAPFQPIDFRLEFEQDCWAMNETIHSVRIAYNDGTDLVELESQIYDLSFRNSNNIDACSCVFLLPMDITGDETYYAYYSNKETEQPTYEDHLTIMDNHYFYEPISGQLIDFDYYQIIEDEYIIYGVCQRGELLGNGMSNTVIKLLPDSKEFKTKNAEQIASFYMSYSTDPSGTHTGSQWANEIVKKVLVDGNLMIRLQIQGLSPNGNIKTDNIYSYYYCPTITKKIHVNINHDVLNTVEVKGDKERDGTYASLSTIKARSGTIEDMNIGEIMPKIHLFGEDETIRSYDMPTDPDVDPAEWLLSSTDDEDLGSKAWFCIDDPDTGMTHGLIFERNTGYSEGLDDGIQVKSSVHQHVKLLGLEADSGDVYAMRNAYENGEHDATLSEKIDISFNVAYIAAQTGGYEVVDRESEIYQLLIQNRPIVSGNVTDEPTEEKEDRYILTAYVQFAPSAPLGSLLSAGTGRNISYLTAELYKQNTLASSGSAQRLQLGDVNVDFEGKSFSEKIQTIRGMFDLKNSSLLKKVRFPDLFKGVYLVKVYKENPLLGNERKYIGFSIVEVNEDTKTNIYCKSESNIDIDIIDDNQHGIKNVYSKILYDDVIVADGYTDEDGSLQLSIPLYTNKQFTIQSIYQGFSIIKENVNLGFLNKWKRIEQTYPVKLNDVTVNVKDTLGLPPAIDPNVLITSKNMIEQQNIEPETIKPGQYLFSSIYPESYQLRMSYKSFSIDETIEIDGDATKDILFPAEFNLNIVLFDAYGMPLDNGAFSLMRENKGISNKNFKDANIIATIPPGSYNIDINYEDELIASQDIEIKGDRSLDIISNHPSTIHTVGPVLLLLIGIIGFSICYWKRKKHLAFHVLILFIILLSILQPWWLLTGEDNAISTESKTLLYPAHIITLTTTNSIIGGEISEVPEDFTMVLNIIMYIILIAAIVTIIAGFISFYYPKISWILTIVTIIFLILSAVLFYVAMSEVTKVGIGDFSGSNTIAISIPGQMNQKEIACSWGPSFGLYLVIIAIIGMLMLLLKNKIVPIIKKIH